MARLSAVGRGRAIGNLGRAPVPEWEEVARAAWPGHLPRSLAELAARAHLPLVLLSLGGILLAAWLGLPWLGLTAWVVGAAVEWLATPADPPITRLLDLVGLRPQLRALLRSLPALALVFVSADVLAGLGYLTAVLFVQLAWSVQPVLATWLARSAPPLRYLPGAATQPAPFTAHARAYARGVGTPGTLAGLELIALACALAPIPAWLALTGAGLVSLGAVSYLGWTALTARTLRAGQRSSGDALLAELAELAPAFLAYVSLGARQSKYIVNQWLPALNAQPLAGVMLVREASQLAPLAETHHPVVYAPGSKHVEQLTLPSVRAALYFAYGERNSTLLRDPRLRHVMLAHGDSDKATSANGMIRAFDETWVAGQAAIDRFTAAGIELEPSRFAVIGRPQVAGLPIGPTGRSPQVLLYAPTFEGYYEQTTHSSLDIMGVELVRRIVAGHHPELRVWFRPHPASGVLRPSMLAAIDQINALLRAAGDGHLVVSDRGLTLPECLAEADLLVSDVSSVVSDYLYTERPVIVCNPAGLAPEEFVAAYPSLSSAYLFDPALEALDDVLALALGEDPLRQARIATKRHVLGDPPGGPQAAFAANLARLSADG